MSSSSHYLRIFPLSMVLFPGVSVPLHIFEERYKTMIGECVDLEDPFGIVLAKVVPPDQQPDQHLIGTSAVITEVEWLDDGEMNIVIRGTNRFRIVEMIHDQQYPAARVEYIKPDHAEVDPELVERVSTLFSQYLGKLLSIVGNRVAVLELPQDPWKLSAIVASLLMISLEERQGLLENLDLGMTLEAEAEHLEGQIELLESNSGLPAGIARPFPLDEYIPDICKN